MKRVTVLICCYNGAATLSKALDSAVHQTLSPDQYEVLVIDDGSTDATPNLINDYSKSFSNLRGIRNPQNLGLVASCNRGLAEAQGEYFIRLDADDTFAPEILEALSKPLASGETDFSYSDRYEVFLPEARTDYVRVDPFNIYNLIAIGTMLRTELVRAIGGYQPLFWEEFDLYIRYLLKSGQPPFYTPQALFYYSNHPSSMTADSIAVAQGWQELLSQWDLETLRKFGTHPELEKIGAQEGKVPS